MKIAQGEIALMCDTCAIDRHQAPEQNGMWRKRRRPLQYFREGEIGIPDECDPVFEGLDFPLCLLEPKFLQGRGAYDHGNRLRVRQDPKNAIEKGREIVVNRDDRVAIGQICPVHQSLLDRRQHHGRFREKLRPILLNKPGRRRPNAHHDVRRTARVKRPEIVDKRGFRSRVVKPCRQQIVLLKLQRPRRLLLKLGPGSFLEVIAIDPDGTAPARPRWFALDAPAMREALSEAPRLIHWVARTDDIDGARRACPIDLGLAHPMERGAFRWWITIPADGHLPGAGVLPTLIQWADECAHPLTPAVRTAAFQHIFSASDTAANRLSRVGRRQQRVVTRP